MSATADRLRPAPDSVAIRCYNLGLGDCFLIAFPRPEQPEEPYYVVIDCGIARGTPDEKNRMRVVVQDIADATGSRLDALAVTHQHYDHVIGFVHAHDIWKTIHVDQLWLPWTEKQNDSDAETIRSRALQLSKAAERGVERAVHVSKAAGKSALHLADDALAVAGESFGVGVQGGVQGGWNNVLSLRSGEEHRIYCEPGDTWTLEGTDVTAYALAPPRFTNRAGEDLLSRRGRPLVFLLEDRAEMYSYDDVDFGAGAANVTRQSPALYADAEPGETLALASALLGSGPDGDENFDRYCPFDPTRQLGWDDALEMPFFWEHYTAAPDWRRVDFDWLEGTSDLALRAGGFTNNVSLVLAFELPKSKRVLLFAGDAQVGNWLSWHKIGQWQPLDPGQLRRNASMNDLLGRVVFYKVAHHGSHNATLRQQGLEKMPSDMTAFIPVSVPVAHDIMRYCPMPYYPLLQALQRKTGGAVFLANGHLLEPLPSGASRQELEKHVRRSESKQDFTVRNGDTLEANVPRWIEFSFDT
jgi:ribonuclease BN (tRNA processing enzyme)